jgi:hypothetical protein
MDSFHPTQSPARGLYVVDASVTEHTDSLVALEFESWTTSEMSVLNGAELHPTETYAEHFVSTSFDSTASSSGLYKVVMSVDLFETWSVDRFRLEFTSGFFMGNFVSAEVDVSMHTATVNVTEPDASAEAVYRSDAGVSMLDVT